MKYSEKGPIQGIDETAGWRGEEISREKSALLEKEEGGHFLEKPRWSYRRESLPTKKLKLSSIAKTFLKPDRGGRGTTGGYWRTSRPRYGGGNARGKDSREPGGKGKKIAEGKLKTYHMPDGPR